MRGAEEALTADGHGGGVRMQGYQDLVTWQRGMDLVLAVYHVTKQWPREEQHGLTSQVRRAAVAIPSNLMEGHGRTGPREFAHHASIANGSLRALETQLLLADRLRYTPPDESMDLAALTTKVRRLLRGLLRSLHGSVEPN